jgi:polyadenylate-binding protein
MLKTQERFRRFFEPKENGIHVSNLPAIVTVEFLKSLFSEAGTVINVVLKQKPTKCFAFIDFALAEEAIVAVTDFNYTKLNGDSIIVTRTTAEVIEAIKSGESNLFVRGLDPSVDNIQLHELFSNYGEVISVRVPISNGIPRGFAYVQYLKKDDAERAQKELTDSTINGKEISIVKFLKREDRPMSEAMQRNLDPTFTNIFVKNLPESVATLIDLIKLFREYGEILSARLVAHRRIGYVRMAEHDSAVRAVVGLCGRTIFGSRISCCRSLSYAERQQFMKNSKEVKNIEEPAQQPPVKEEPNMPDLGGSVPTQEKIDSSSGIHSSLESSV